MEEIDTASDSSDTSSESQETETETKTEVKSHITHDKLVSYDAYLDALDPEANYGSWFVDWEENGQFKDTWDKLQKEGRKVQEKAMEKIIFNDDETQELYDFYQEEVIRRAA